jgi:hypothetical protein
MSKRQLVLRQGHGIPAAGHYKLVVRQGGLVLLVRRVSVG